MDTELVDASDIMLKDLLILEDPNLEKVSQIVINQVIKTRYNLGGSGPPGRAD